MGNLHNLGSNLIAVIIQVHTHKREREKVLRVHKEIVMSKTAFKLQPPSRYHGSWNPSKIALDTYKRYSA